MTMWARLLAGAFVATAAEWTPEVTDPCGDPRSVSQAYAGYQATVVEVIDPVTLLVNVEQPPGMASLAPCEAGPCKVRLVDLVSPADPAIADPIRRSLSERCRSKKVSLQVSPHQPDGAFVNAIVTLDRMLNEEQLESGSATYRQEAPYAVDWYVECRLKRAQAIAQAAHRGVWRHKGVK